jgi:hypothetical protein
VPALDSSLGAGGDGDGVSVCSGEALRLRRFISSREAE